MSSCLERSWVGSRYCRLSPTLTWSTSSSQERDSAGETTTNPLMLPETSPELSEMVAEETEAMEELGSGVTEQLEELGGLQEEGGTELEVRQVGSELEEEEEELGTEEQEEDQEPCEEPNNLGDPAVMRAVQSKPTLEVTRERRGGGPPQGEGLVGPCPREEDLPCPG